MFIIKVAFAKIRKLFSCPADSKHGYPTQLTVSHTADYGKRNTLTVCTIQTYSLDCAFSCGLGWDAQ